MNDQYKLLLLEDNPADAELQLKLLKRAGLKIDARVVSDEGEFLAALNQNGFDAVLADNSLPQYSSVEALQLLRNRNPHVAFILVTGTVSEEFAVSILQQGADDYILKTNLTRLPSAIKSAIEKKRIQREKQLAEAEIVKEQVLSQSIINSLPGLFFLCNREGAILRGNRNFERISGLESKMSGLIRLNDLLVTEDPEACAKFIQNSLATGHGQLVARFQTRNGNRVPYMFTATAVLFEDKDCLVCVGLDISASMANEAELREMNRRLRSLSARLEQIREEERKYIAREIHDELGQLLTVLKMDTRWMTKRLGLVDNRMILDRLNDMSSLIDEGVSTIRKIASELRPSILDDMGLVAALEWQAREFEKRFSIPVELSLPAGGVELSSEVNTTLFRLFQESLTNIARHANASRVTCKGSMADGRFILSVADNGNGFDLAETRNVKSFGLLGMKERVLAMGGDIEIYSEPGKGTQITVRAPAFPPR